VTKQDLLEIKQALVEHIDQATQGLRAEMVQRMDAHAASQEKRVDQAVRDLRAEMQQRMDALRVEMLQRMDALRVEMLQRMDALRVEMLQRMDEHAASLEESIRDAQTEMLKAFISYQEGQQIRMRGFESKDVEITERMAVLERRLQEIERRLLLNPPAA